MAGADVWHTARIDDPPVPAIRMSDGPAGVRGRRGPDRRRSRSRAVLPSAPRSTRSSSPRSVDALAEECIARGVHVLLGPTVNLARTPIGGRNFECFGEDPLLTAELAVGYIDGLQRRRVAACVKHFVANDTEFERMTVSAEVDEETLRELYLVPFEAAVTRAGVRCVMSAYNRLTGRSARSTSGCSATCCAATGASTVSSSATGTGVTAARRRCGPDSTSRCPGLRSIAAPGSPPRSPPARRRRTTSTAP